MNSSRNIWLLNLSTFFFFLGASSLNPIVSPFSMTFNASPFIVGVLAGITSVVSLASKPIGGIIGDRGYRLEAMILGNILSLVSGVLYVVSALVSNIWLFAFTRALHGFSMGIFYPSSLSTAVDLAPPGRVGETLGWRGMMFSLGNIIGPALGGYASDYFGFAGAFFLVVLFSAIGALFVVPVRRDVGKIAVSGKKREKADYSELLRLHFVAVSVALLFFSASYSGVTTFLPALYKELSYPQRVFGRYMMIVGVASFATRLIGGKNADRMGPIPVSAAGLLTVITGYLLLTQATLPPGFLRERRFHRCWLWSGSSCDAAHGPRKPAREDKDDGLKRLHDVLRPRNNGRPVRPRLRRGKPRLCWNSEVSTCPGRDSPFNAGLCILRGG